MTAIRNVVFDIGNVFVRWHPPTIVESAFGLSGTEAEARRRALFVESDIWRALNRGEHSEAEAKRAYVYAGLLSEEEADPFFAAIYDSLELLADTPPLMERLAEAGFRLFALTDNVREIVAHLAKTHEWWGRFEGVSNSAEIGVLKPDPRMFRHVLETNGLVAGETVFFDDMPGNVEGARKAGMHAFVFTDAAQAKRDLRSLGVAV
ncbi:HAD family hydrolase [Qipengyuania sp. MTN3-11]|uniref:HAD family hydrolase n=1 Tax=Qipengyuania sp. MTN3-11 TaxID=3056557 RepID=UPI0036F449FA